MYCGQNKVQYSWNDHASDKYRDNFTSLLLFKVSWFIYTKDHISPFAHNVSHCKLMFSWLFAIIPQGLFRNAISQNTVPYHFKVCPTFFVPRYKTLHLTVLQHILFNCIPVNKRSRTFRNSALNIFLYLSSQSLCQKK